MLIAASCVLLQITAHSRTMQVMKHTPEKTVLDWALLTHCDLFKLNHPLASTLGPIQLFQEWGTSIVIL